MKEGLRISKGRVQLRFLFSPRITNRFRSSYVKKEVMIMNEGGTSTERRQSPRAKTSIPVRYRVLRDGVEAVGVGSVTCDLGTGGLRFTANEFLSTSCRVALEFDIPALTQPIKAVSKVAWTRQADGGNDSQYTIGSRFMEITERDKELIAKYVSSH
jgi:hypothetical protein